MSERNAMLERIDALQTEIATVTVDLNAIEFPTDADLDAMYYARDMATAELETLQGMLEAMDDATDWDSMAEDYMDAVYYAEGAGL